MDEDKKEKFILWLILALLSVLVVLLSLAITIPITRSSKATKYDLDCVGTLEECKEQTNGK